MSFADTWRRDARVEGADKASPSHVTPADVKDEPPRLPTAPHIKETSLSSASPPQVHQAEPTPETSSGMHGTLTRSANASTPGPPTTNRRASICLLFFLISVITALIGRYYIWLPLKAWSGEPAPRTGTKASSLRENATLNPFFCPNGDVICDPPPFFTHLSDDIAASAKFMTKRTPEHTGTVDFAMLVHVTHPKYVEYNETRFRLYGDITLDGHRSVRLVIYWMEELRREMEKEVAGHSRSAVLHLRSCAASSVTTDPAVGTGRYLKFFPQWQQQTTTNATLAICEPEALTQFLAAVNNTYLEYLKSLSPLAAQLEQDMLYYQLGVKGMFKVDRLTHWKCRLRNRGVSCRDAFTGEVTAQSVFETLNMADVSLMLARIDARTKPIAKHLRNLKAWMEDVHDVPAALQSKTEEYKTFIQEPEAAELEVWRVGNMVMAGRHVDAGFARGTTERYLRY
ncbi:hypothetical protein PMIN01_12241 [Paraphaeosphaeria minitans]|uniref:Uncharacterized protein n=1 Tax=Paraphaeosphaeria minitans TaxID=565426 RepID=A0A9P6G5D7_9PLEO|nr:hypothetical protein PMIN01_12241 [Paraphaeosphaeria minitans]